MSDPIQIRAYLPQSLATVGQMAPAINAAASRYGVDARAIAGAIALEQNNSEQFSFRYTAGNLASAVMLNQRDENGQHRLSSDDIYNLAQQARQSTPNPTDYEKVCAERVGASTAMRNSRTYSRQRFGARSRPATASCCTKNTAKDFANKMQNPGHLSLGQGKALLV